MAKARQTGSWSAASTLTRKPPVARIRGQLVLARSGRNPTSGGFRETEVKVPTTIAAVPPSASVAVTTATPVGCSPSARRSSAGLTGADGADIGLPQSKSE